MSKTKADLTALCAHYETLRAQETMIKKDKEQIGTQIKAAFGDKLDLPNPKFILSYHYDADKTNYTVDYATMEKEDAKAFKKWVTKTTQPGSRRLTVKRIEEAL